MPGSATEDLDEEVEAVTSRVDRYLLPPPTPAPAKDDNNSLKIKFK